MPHYHTFLFQQQDKTDVTCCHFSLAGIHTLPFNTFWATLCETLRGTGSECHLLPQWSSFRQLGGRNFQISRVFSKSRGETTGKHFLHNIIYMVVENPSVDSPPDLAVCLEIGVIGQFTVDQDCSYLTSFSCCVHSFHWIKALPLFIRINMFQPSHQCGICWWLGCPLTIFNFKSSKTPVFDQFHPQFLKGWNYRNWVLEV